MRSNLEDWSCERIAACCLSDPEVQRAQIRYRVELARTWRIEPGSRVLELGCGQGNMTAVLAAAVGPTGHVDAVDTAAPSYGAPETLGDATTYLKNSEVGSQVDFYLQTSLPGSQLLNNHYDYVAMVHASWYTASEAELLQLLEAGYQAGDCLLFAEWDLRPKRIEQLPHLLAVTIEGTIESHKPESHANIRTPLSRERTLELIEAAGWQIEEVASPDTSEQQDGAWEVSDCLRFAENEIAALEVNERVKSFLRSELNLLRSYERSPALALPSYSLRAGK